MKHSAIYFLIFISSIVEICNAQSFAPTGAKWDFEVRSAITSLNVYREWLVVGDTTIQNKLCKIISLQTVGNQMPIINPFDSTYNLFVYDSSGFVFRFNQTLNHFSNFYNFNLNASDSMLIELENCTINFVIDSTNYVTINGQNRKVQYGKYLTTQSSRPVRIVEGIGDLYCCLYPAYEKILICEGVIWDGPMYYGLRCYEDSIIGQYNSGLENDCHYYFNPGHEVETGIIDLNSQSEFSIYPNPCSTIIHLNIGNNYSQIKFINIYNAYGQCLMTTTNKNEIDLTEFPNGFYLLQTVFKNGELEFHKFIKE